MSQFNSPFVPPSLPGMGTPEYTEGAPGQLRQVGVRAPDGSLYTSQQTMNMGQGQPGFTVDPSRY